MERTITFSLGKNLTHEHEHHENEHEQHLSISFNVFNVMNVFIRLHRCIRMYGVWYGKPHQRTKRRR